MVEEGRNTTAVFTESSLLIQESGVRGAPHYQQLCNAYSGGLGVRRRDKNVLSHTTLCQRKNSRQLIVELCFFPISDMPHRHPHTNISKRQSQEEMKGEQQFKKMCQKNNAETVQKEWVQGTGQASSWRGLVVNYLEILGELPKL